MSKERGQERGENVADKISKYQEVADWLRENIYKGNFKVGEKLVSEPGLCKKFDISRHTARSAITLLEQEGLVVRRQGSGTYVNQFISNGGRKKIGLLLTYPDDYIFPSIVSGATEIFSEKDHRMFLSLTQNKVEDERNQLLSFLSDDIDGLIVEAVKSALPSINLDIYREFAARSIPIIFINTYHNRLDCNYIINDDVEGGRLAARHLIEKGHKKIGGIFKHDDAQGNYRYKGFAKELYEQNLKVHEDYITWFSTETQEDLFSPDQFKLLSNRLAGASGVVCYNDQVAVKLVQAFTQAGLNIPEDLSVVSFDDSSLSRMNSIPLTSVTHPGTEMGRLAAESLLEIIDNPERSIHHVYKPELVVRDSVQDIVKP